MMRKRLFVLLGVLLTALTAQAQFKNKNTEPVAVDEWNDIEIFEQNKIYPRANVIPFAKESGIEKWEYAKSPNYVSLNGTWKVQFQKNYDSTYFVENKNFSAEGWQTTTVPAARWNDNGTLLKAPILKKGNTIPSKQNTVATYYREFNVPKTWSGYEAFLNLQAKSAFYVWVNQKYVGYSEDSRAFSEFNITKHLKYGKPNNIIIQVASASDGSLLEMNNALGLNGITSDVFVCLKTQANVNDYSIVANYDKNSKFGNFSIDVSVFNKSQKGQYYVEVELWTPQGKQLEKMGRWVFFDKKNENHLTLERELGGVKPWTAETPNLYTAVIRLRDEKMQLLETVGTRFGFRSVEVNDGKLLVNGKAITLKGVVYVPFTTENNGIYTRERMKKDLMLMKQNNINAIRTSVYSPVDPYLYELCDEYGFYVLCDANLMPYSNQSEAIATKKEYADLFVARVQNAYERFKNHTSIITWSLGNTLDNGICMERSYKTFKQKDKTRPVAFAGADFSENTDIILSRFSTVDYLKQYLSKPQSRPLIFAAFGSTQGNNFGGMEQVWKMVRNNNKLQGGFVSYWGPFSFFDQSKNQELQMSGLVDELQQESPYLAELRNLYRNFDVRLVNLSPDAGEFTVENLMDYSTLSNYILEYNIFSNLKTRIIEGEVNVSLAPGEAKNFKLKVPKLTLYAGEELYIRFTIRQRNNTELVPKGTELGIVEFPLPMKKVKKQPLPAYDREELLVKEYPGDNGSNGTIQLFNESFEVWFDLDKGEMTSYKLFDQSLFSQAPRLNFWRPYTDNDKVDRNGAKNWAPLASSQLKREVVATHWRMIDKTTVGIDVMLHYLDASGAVMFDVKQTIAVLYTGDVIYDNEVKVAEALKNIPKIGMQFNLEKNLSTTQWFGMDKETYADRKASGKLGTYTLPTKDLFHHYARPQESGNRTDVRWTSFNDSTYGMFIDILDTVFNFSVYPYTDKQLNENTTFSNMRENNSWTVNIDLMQSGIGSAMAGQETSDEYLLMRKKYRFKVHFRGYSKEENDPNDFCRVSYPEVESSVLPMPEINKDRDRFDAPMTVTMSTIVPNAEIHYTLDGSTPTEKSPLYKKPFTLSNSTIVKAKTFKKGATPSFIATRRYNFDYITSVKYAHNANTPYNFEANKILFDGEWAEISDLSHGWLGFSGNDYEAVFELSKAIEVQSVEMHFAHVPDAWTFAPQAVSVYVSDNGEDYSPAYRAVIKYDPASEEMNFPQLVKILVDVNSKDVKFVKVVAKNMGKIPVWHKAKGLRPWIMTDEIQLNEVIR